MKAIFLLLVFSLVIACGDNPTDTNPLDSDLKEEFQLKGTISGTVTDTAGISISGVAVTLDTGGFATNTDDNGNYTIPSVPGGKWTVRFTKANYRDTSVADVAIAIDEEVMDVDMVLTPEVDSLILNLLDSLTTERDILGELVDYDEVDRVEARVSFVDDTTSIPVEELDFDVATGKFSALIAVPKDSGLLEILVIDQNDRMTGYTAISFGSGATALQVPEFLAVNALPRVEVGADTAAIGGTVFTRMGLAEDSSYNAGIASMEWNCLGSWEESSDGSLNIILPTDVESVVCSFRATDLDGNVADAFFELEVLASLEAVLVDSGASDFYVSQYEITQAQGVELLNSESESLTFEDMSTNGSFGSVLLGSTKLVGYMERQGDAYWVDGQYDETALNTLSWYGAAWFCNALSRRAGLELVYNETDWTADPSKNGWRLPTNGEWEWAARGGALSVGYAYAGSDDATLVAWYKSGVTLLSPQDVGTKAANELELFDMNGNASEWTAEAYVKGGNYGSLIGDLDLSATASLNKADVGMENGLRVVRNGE